MRVRKHYPYEPYLKEYAKRLRNDSTLSEVLLWDYLKSKQMLGYDFHRQKPLLKYIVDFFCSELDLAIEIDGDSHDNEETSTKDDQRQKQIEELGITFLRFDDGEVKNDIENVLRVIQHWIEDYREKH